MPCEFFICFGKHAFRAKHGINPAKKFRKRHLAEKRPNSRYGSEYRKVSRKSGIKKMAKIVEKFILCYHVNAKTRVV
ncbi:MAG: hypothetical protein A3H69_04035 [Candidatus Sungbacteria bacterium RIFCSPLOWO2_02_FULL_47_9]|uniref:Uncharacterized protein n=1 Tax=Candidatus Sungbacteria bacterium RIFCSPHIGHO2_01_FULL_47_32 TaxID=1802264 RepID=A0A1G2KBN8_9BACT|nr:MAG: hypothetical protein A2633_00330 [Candidatus Sungbacteria bacterium RIFCSPHIGHO2_01_FULL_47_32]OGZ98620.1 MAG: hypothetical protein A3D57_03565 [Candidatus Sungbacteria bacterium RIFCSPHIGHO2_02_FULL_46_12]OHA04425.1 MAG: hypothetical protein A3A28_06045 [Candidatus Sungbacteria bacterium RIFCSPLOWO2_01_FULL_47_32]OHA11781.1 MAG: hypothetical protein A3H69_04035 [Candidatus Sungbacteria bacterium RIFCSPLOWO2_02_FULL_47_9]